MAVMTVPELPAEPLHLTTTGLLLVLDEIRAHILLGDSPAGIIEWGPAEQKYAEASDDGGRSLYAVKGAYGIDSWPTGRLIGTEHVRDNSGGHSARPSHWEEP